LGFCFFAGGSGAAAPDEYDVFSDDATSGTLNHLTTNIPQQHTIAGAADEAPAAKQDEQSQGAPEEGRAVAPDSGDSGATELPPASE